MPRLGLRSLSPLRRAEEIGEDEKEVVWLAEREGRRKEGRGLVDRRRGRAKTLVRRDLVVQCIMGGKMRSGERWVVFNGDDTCKPFVRNFLRGSLETERRSDQASRVSKNLTP